MVILVITAAITTTTTTVATAQSTTSTPLYYPNWSGGTNNCLLDCFEDDDPSSSNNCTPRPEYMDTSNNLMKGTLSECCNSYYWWDLNVCLSSEEEESGDELLNDGNGEGGTQVWYADYTNFKCTLQQQNNEITTTVNNNETLFDSAENCCIDQFPYLALGMCLSHSNGELIYEGSKMYYVDYTNGRCVQDCAASSSSNTDSNTNNNNEEEGICSGIITESSTQLYDTKSNCCSGQLSYIDPYLCEVRSTKNKAEGGTFRLYPNVQTGSCVIDHPPDNVLICSIGYDCVQLEPTSYVSKLYMVSPTGVDECCSIGLSYVNPTYCKSKTMGVFSRMWFVDYSAKLCRQDCKPSDNPEDTSCAKNNDPAASYYDTPEECCSSKLGYINQEKCHADSKGIEYQGSFMYYVNYGESKCSQDCPMSNEGDCNGVVQDSSTALYPDATQCCATSLSYMNSDLCESKSDSTSTGTGKYYHRKDDDYCVKDTTESMCPPGEICQRVTGWVSSLYEKAKGCCTKELSGVVDVDTCVAKSKNGGVLSDEFSGGTQKWYVDWIHQQCVRDCPVGSDSGCGGISSHNTWVELYTQVDDCCANLHYIEHPCVKTD